MYCPVDHSLALHRGSLSRYPIPALRLCELVVIYVSVSVQIVVLQDLVQYRGQFPVLQLDALRVLVGLVLFMEVGQGGCQLQTVQLVIIIVIVQFEVVELHGLVVVQLQRIGLFRVKSFFDVFFQVPIQTCTSCGGIHT